MQDHFVLTARTFQCCRSTMSCQIGATSVGLYVSCCMPASKRELDISDRLGSLPLHDKYMVNNELSVENNKYINGLLLAGSYSLVKHTKCVHTVWKTFDRMIAKLQGVVPTCSVAQQRISIFEFEFNG